MEKKKCSVCGKPLEDNNSKDDMCQVCYAVKEVRTQRNLLSNKSRKEKNDVVQFKLEKGERGGMQNKFINKDGFKSLTDFICFGIALAGVSLVIGFVLYAVADVDKKAQVKQRIIQTMFGIVGIILAISLVNLIISLF